MQGGSRCGWSECETDPASSHPKFPKEFELPGWNFTIPAPAGEELASDDDSDPLPPTGQTKYRSGVGKLMHFSRWSHVGILNRTRELAKFTTNPCESCMKALLRVLRYVVSTAEVGVTLQPRRQWDSDGKDNDFLLFEITRYEE
jgi:hypothetical protein